MRAFSGKMAGSISARRLIPVVAILPATLGFLFFMAYRHNLISSETGMAVIILTLILIFLFLLRYHAESLNQWANKRLLAEHEVRVLNEQLEQKVKERTSDLEQSEANLQAIFNNTAVGFLLLNTHYEILSFNERFKSAFLRVYEKQINIHQNYLDLFPQERRMFMIDQFIQAASYNQLVEYEISIPEGQPELYFRVNIIPVKSQNELVGYSVSVTEITQRRILKLQIEKMNQDLIQRNKELEQFTFIVSHNLRSPIANISGISNILVDPNIDESNLRKMGSEMAKSIRRLDGVVQDLNMILDVKKGLDDASEPVSLTALVNGIKESISTVIEETGTVIYLDFNACNEMITIRSYLHSIFYNLITNSIKYRKLDNPCEISISSRIQEKQLIIEFSDNGIGMDLETMGDQLFGLYKRFHRNIEGKGVGLYIVKLQVESLGGMISVASTLNKGTTFTITFKMN
jgi:signal transduction histidine kinase